MRNLNGLGMALAMAAGCCFATTAVASNGEAASLSTKSLHAKPAVSALTAPHVARTPAPRGGCDSINAGGCTPASVDLQVGITGGFQQDCGSNEWVSLAFPIDTGAGATIQAINMTHLTNTGVGDLYLTGDGGGCPDVNNILWTGDSVIDNNGTGLPTTYCTGPIGATGTVWVVAVYHGSFAFDVMYEDDGSGGSNFGRAYGDLVADGSCVNWQDLANFAFGYCYHVNVDLADGCGDCAEPIFNGCVGGEGEGEGEGEDEPCPGAGGDCCIADGTPGCDDIDCCEAICAADPFCCDVAWDQLCADAAIANPLCADEGSCPTSEPETCDTWLCDGDANGDGIVDPLDTGYILARFGLDPCVEGCAADVNCDGVIDPLDSGYALARFNTCDEPPACESSCQAPAGADNCEDAAITTLNLGDSLVYNLNNEGATMQCAAGGFNETWTAIQTSETVNLTVSLCGTSPAFGNAYIVIDDSCPCDGTFIFFTSFINECDGNWVVHYDGLPAGTYWIPTLEEPGSSGDYTLTISAS